jgi:hypothetical protein
MMFRLGTEADRGWAQVPARFMLFAAENVQRRVAFLPWIQVRLRGLNVNDFSNNPTTLGEHLKKASNAGSSSATSRSPFRSTACRS